MAEDRETPKGLNILCIDSGGIRGLSSLVVLQEIMLRVEANSGRQVHPHMHFDMIAGTGTGGISACMLGRLRMSIQNAIQAYSDLMESVFTDKKSIGSTVYKGTKLQEALKTTVRNATGDQDEKMLETQASECKTAVFAMAKHNLNTGLPVIFRSCVVAANPCPHCTIREAIYATMAHPDLFKGIEIVSELGPQSFIGGELGCSNPLAHVLSEIQRVYPGRQVACIISIGAGHARTIQIPGPSLRRMILGSQDVVVMKEMATDSERVAEEMAVRFRDVKNVYFRFNADQGMQNLKAGSWERRDEVVAHTSAYLQKSETNQKPGLAVRSSVERVETIPTGHIGGQHGSILITTRLPDLARLAKGPGSVCRLSSMRLALLIKAARLEDQYLSDEETEAAEALLKGFGYLALAIVHASAFIAHVPGMTLVKYQSLFLSRKKDMLEQYRGLPATAKLDDYGETVYTTWKMCHNQLQPESRSMLSLMAYLHYDRISESIFENAFLGIESHENVIPQTELEVLAQNHVNQYLSTFDSDGSWDSLRFATVMTDLISYSLVDFDRINLAYSIHLLVQDWARSVVSQPHELATEYTAALLSLSVDWEESAESMAFMRHLGPHVDSVLKHNPSIGPNHMNNFPAVYHRTGQWALQEKIQRRVVEMCQQFLGQDDPYTLRAMGRLAETHCSLGQWDQAERLQLWVLDAEKARLGEEHPDTMTTIAWLAQIYSELGRWDEAEQLQVKVLDASKRVSREEHPDTLKHIGNLAHTYSMLGRYQEAEQLQIQVLDAHKRLLGMDHPHTVTSMHRLALTYYESGRLYEAEQLQTKELDASKRVLGEERPDTLKSIVQLGHIYSRLGWWNNVEDLYITAISISERVLGKSHPSTCSYREALDVMQAMRQKE
ncbi:Nephrocystin-3 [Mus musculus] [Rhizoctonia solani]|uniref:Nephrocystin-3 [Mus musculus] n=1 Tax=Rhizoctonia solani TaxID=456999 RepID=A0A0K6G775_9AGAM|nr:Nephrocystin-3 [Mus musculus] [Rhizoctonia solani]